VKPAAQGSSLGVRVVTGIKEMPDALMTAFSYGSSALVETWVSGRELAVSILDGEVLPIVEAVPTESATYDFEARYEVGGATFTSPARLSPEDEAAARATALAAYEALGCSEFSRVDLILGKEGPSVLEVNAIPGLTETSLLPQAAEAAGVGFDDLIERLLEMAVAGKGPRSS
jgi:D-alanine-D-alanine ligase